MTEASICESCSNIGCDLQSGIDRKECKYYIPDYYLTYDQLEEINDVFRLKDLLSLSRAVRAGRVVITQETDHENKLIIFRVR